MNETYLAHHGVKGQKWGVRRYQNEDGSLTPAGKRRYLSGSAQQLVKSAVKTAGTTHKLATNVGLATHKGATAAGVGTHKVATKAGLKTHELATKAGKGTHKAATKAGLETHEVATKAGLKTHKVATKAGLKTHQIATKAGLKTHKVATKVGVESVKAYNKGRKVTRKIALKSLTAPIDATNYILGKGNAFVKRVKSGKLVDKRKADKGKRYVEND